MGGNNEIAYIFETQRKYGPTSKIHIPSLVAIHQKTLEKIGGNHKIANFYKYLPQNNP